MDQPPTFRGFFGSLEALISSVPGSLVRAYVVVTYTYVAVLTEHARC